MNTKDLLQYLFERGTLNETEAEHALTQLAKGTFNQSQATAFITVFMMRNITPKELLGFRNAMLALCNSIELSEYETIDLCGTGGDGKNTFNISTTAAFVVATSGLNVAKHGNFGVSSVCGSSNLMEHLGVRFTNEQDELKKALDRSGICFLHAPLFHPAMKKMAPIRQELGMKTFFNMLGPLVNPARPKNQLTGVFHASLFRTYQYLLQQGNTNYGVLYSSDGFDEISLTSSFRISTSQFDYVLEPEDIGFQKYKTNDLSGGDSIAENAAIFLAILKGKGTQAQHQVVAANAGAALFVAGKAESLVAGCQIALSIIESGAAFQTFQNHLKN